MANERIPNDPYRTGLSDDNFGRPQRFDEEMQVDPELQEGPASSTKIALFAVGIAIVLGAVFYGLNNTSVNEAQTTPRCVSPAGVKRWLARRRARREQFESRLRLAGDALVRR